MAACTNQSQNNFTVFVGNLPFQTEAEDLCSLFEANGTKVKDVKLIKSPQGKLKGSGFVSFQNEEDMKNAVKLNGFKFNGRQIRVNETVPKTKS